MTQVQINKINRKLDEVERLVRDIRRELGSTSGPSPSSSGLKKPRTQMQNDQPDYSDVDGVVGTFDGVSMITTDGRKYEVPANYAAKSKLVFGDTLKLIEEDGKQIYKHINKAARHKSEGILTKKDGLWYVLTDRGSYKVSDVAADFQKAEVNAQVKLLLPADNLDAPFATIDEIEKPKETKEKDFESPILSQAYTEDVKPLPDTASTNLGDDDLV